MADFQGLKTLTIRDFYKHNNSLTRPTAKDLDRQAQLFDVCLDGEPLGDKLQEVRRDNPYSTTWTKPYNEGLDVARVLLAAGLEPVAIETHPDPAPDTLVTFRDGSTARVEVGAIVDPDSAKRAGAVEFMRHRLREAVAGSSELQKRLRGRAMGVSLDTVPTTTNAQTACVDEILAFLKSSAPIYTLSLPMRFSKAYAALSQYGASYRAAKYPGVMITIAPIVNADAPSKAVAAFRRMLEQKKKKTYAGDGPLWLALVLDDTEQIEAEALDAIRSTLSDVDIAPFAKLIVGYERDAAIVT